MWSFTEFFFSFVEAVSYEITRIGYTCPELQIPQPTLQNLPFSFLIINVGSPSTPSPISHGPLILKGLFRPPFRVTACSLLGYKNFSQRSSK